MKRTVNITWLGHACFKLSAEDYSIVIDPYKDGMVPGLSKLRCEANAVYCSHDHDDHSWTEAVTITEGTASPFEVTEFVTPHDDVNGKKRGMNTVRIFKYGELRIAHMGDIGRPLKETEAETLRSVDALLVPIGGFFTIDAMQAKEMVDIIKPRVVIPMHYRTNVFGFPVIAPISAFTKLFDRVEYGGNSLELSETTPGQVLVMTLK